MNNVERRKGPFQQKGPTYTLCQQRMPRWGGLAGTNSTINFTQAAEFAIPTFNDVHQGGGMRSRRSGFPA